MSFVVTAALAVFALVAAPIVAHLLRRGRTREQTFPAASLVAPLEAHSRERTRLRDRSLLALRAAMVTALAVLGATPLVRCSRLSVDRPEGASVALALVIDDSHSMRARTPAGPTRFEAAIAGARQLMRSLREGDAVAFVLAGKPARLALSATTDLGAARATLDELYQSDRSSDLDNAIRLARSALESLEHPDRRAIVLGDLAGSHLDAADVEAPLASLREPVADCGIVLAERRGNRLEVSLACNAEAHAARKLRIDAQSAEAILVDPSLMSQLTLAPHAGAQSLSFALEPDAGEFQLELTPPDGLPENDRAFAARSTEKLQIAVVADESQAHAITGGATVIEQALLALRPGAAVRPLGILPDRPAALEGYGALVVNDPRGLGPEAREALTRWIEEGGVALGLLGPAAASLQLSSSLEPFAARSARWESRSTARDLDPASVAWLEAGGAGLQALSRSGRMRLDGALLPDSVVVGKWTDGVPFLIRRKLGSGLVLSAGLPASVRESELSLRPLFLSLLDHVLGAAESRRGPDLSVAGTVWTFDGDRAVRVEGPAGPVALASGECRDADEDCSGDQRSMVADRAGAYRVETEGVERTRVVRIDEREIIDAPGTATARDRGPTAGAGAGTVDASPELALVLLGLFAIELLVRVVSQTRRRRRVRIGAARAGA